MLNLFSCIAGVKGFGGKGHSKGNDISANISMNIIRAFLMAGKGMQL